jgi:hypothetical protein
MILVMALADTVTFLAIRFVAWGDESEFKMAMQGPNVHS